MDDFRCFQVRRNISKSGITCNILKPWARCYFLLPYMHPSKMHNDSGYVVSVTTRQTFSALSYTGNDLHCHKMHCHCAMLTNVIPNGVDWLLRSHGVHGAYFILFIFALLLLLLHLPFAWGGHFHITYTLYLGLRKALSSEKSLANNVGVCQSRGDAIGYQIRAKFRAYTRIN